MYFAHADVNGLDFWGEAAFPKWSRHANTSYRLGRSLRFDPQTETVVDDEEANPLLKDLDRGYRSPYLVPEDI